jgi:hypothetical protein
LHLLPLGGDWRRSAGLGGAEGDGNGAADALQQKMITYALVSGYYAAIAEAEDGT